MIDRDTAVTDDELHAYVDGELPGDRLKAVEAWIAMHPEDSARVAAWRSQAELIRVRYGGVARDPVPSRLDFERLRRAERKWTWLAAAAVLLAFVAGSATGWFGRGAMQVPPTAAAPTVTADALEAHKLYIKEVRHPVEVPADAQHLVPWLSRRVVPAHEGDGLVTLGREPRQRHVERRDLAGLL
jgi:anti-sigma factor RsiW